MIKKKDYPPNTGNIIESMYDGVEHPVKKSTLKKKVPKTIKTVDDVHVGKAKKYTRDDGIDYRIRQKATKQNKKDEIENELKERQDG